MPYVVVCAGTTSTKVGNFDSCVNPQTTPSMSGMQAISGSIVNLGRVDSSALLASAPVGRIVFTRGALPAIHPVNFVVEGDDVVITTSEDSRLSGTKPFLAVAPGVIFGYERNTTTTPTCAGTASRSSRSSGTSWDAAEAAHDA
jgi:hypothetical protein